MPLNFDAPQMQPPDPQGALLRRQALIGQMGGPQGPMPMGGGPLPPSPMPPPRQPMPAPVPPMAMPGGPVEGSAGAPPMAMPGGPVEEEDPMMAPVWPLPRRPMGGR